MNPPRVSAGGRPWSARQILRRLFLSTTLLASSSRAHVAADDTDTAPLVSKAGDWAVIPTWHIASSATVKGSTLADSVVALSDALSAVSTPGFPGITSGGWTFVPTPHCTVIGCMAAAGNNVLDVDKLFFSDTMQTALKREDFEKPWIYRSEFRLGKPKRDAGRQHYFLRTNGIASAADIFFNGKAIASADTQRGAYAGHTYDVTALVEAAVGGARGTHALAIRAWPADYSYDLAVGFVDWNPHPADRGMGVWRAVEVHQTGPVALDGAPVVTVDLPGLPDRMDSASVTVAMTVRNLESSRVAVVVNVVVEEEDGNNPVVWEDDLTLAPGASMRLSRTLTIDNPLIWWPRQWGSQPLYRARVYVFADGSKSDVAEQRFGIRTVTSTLNANMDRVFSVNGRPFQVVGAGYTSDIFLRWDAARFRQQAELALDMGLNTLRLEGKMEHPELYDIADELGLMLMPGWECCDKWEAWSYAEYYPVEPVPVWNDSDYAAANASMRHEARMLQPHPSVLCFLIGSDFWPNDRATQMYVDAFRAHGWQTPIISSASGRGFPNLLGSSGMKMLGPYDWVPPNYWYDIDPPRDRAGAAFGFGSELGAGVGTPELASLRRFLSDEDLEDLWRPESADKTLYHMSTNGSQFDDRSIYNNALTRRLGAATSLDDYVAKAQIMDYEATRSQFEAFAAKWSDTLRPATGLIYWMFNNAWPSLHWNLFDYYLRAGGSYFGAKTATRVEHVAYDYVSRAIYLINRSLGETGRRTVEVEAISISGKPIFKTTFVATTEPNKSKVVSSIPLSATPSDERVVFLRLILRDGNPDGNVLSRNVYWLSPTLDSLDWGRTEWYYTPVTRFADYSALGNLAPAQVSIRRSGRASPSGPGRRRSRFTLENHSDTPAFFVRLDLRVSAEGADGDDATPVFWSDNYITLWPREKLDVEVGFGEAHSHGESDGGSKFRSDEKIKLQVSGRNVALTELDVDDGWD